MCGGCRLASRTASDAYLLGAKLLDLASAVQASRLMVTDTPLNLVGGLVDSGKRPPRQSAAVCLAPLWALIERWGHHERRVAVALQY